MTKRIRPAAGVAAGVLFANLIPYLHARAMTHFVPTGSRTAAPEYLSRLQKIGVLCTGVKMPRPVNRTTPKDIGLDFQTVSFKGTGGLSTEAWLINAKASRGLIILFHGYADSKSSLLIQGKGFHDMGYDALLVDFNGSGGSAGNDTSLGYGEAETVAAAVKWADAISTKDKPILYGISMGAGAVLRAVGVLGVKPQGIIVESPFDRLLNSARHRFERMGLPPFPLAQLLVFWGGFAQGFDGFAHNPVEYAKSVRCPALLIYGDQDAYIRADEERGIYDNLSGPKTFKQLQGLGHVNFAKERPAEWREAVIGFLSSLNPRTDSR